MINKKHILKVIKEYFNINNIKNIKEMNLGYINNTYLIEFEDCRYILQKLNNNVFTSPFGVMNNIFLVTDYIKKKCVYEGLNIRKSVLNFIKTKHDQILALVNNEYWRCMEYVEGGKTYTNVSDANLFYEAGKAVGNFQYLLEGFNPDLLDDTIKNFHDTKKRYNQFCKIISNECENRKKINEVRKEIEFIVSRKNKMSLITDKIKNKTLKLRVCHNDTKITNIMIDEKTKKYMCLIDLDTVMKGSLVFDFADALRIGASKTKEDDTNLENVKIDLELVDAFSKGFFYETRKRNNITYISEKEVESLYDAYLIITLELAMRFLMDYIEGDIYFKRDKKRPKHNLDRARNQMKLVLEIEKNKEEIERIIYKHWKEMN